MQPQEFEGMREGLKKKTLPDKVTVLEPKDDAVITEIYSENKGKEVPPSLPPPPTQAPTVGATLMPTGP